MAHDVFVSYSSKDKVTADAVCAAIEARGVRCWIAPRDVMAGVPYGEAIIDAIHDAGVMVLVFSAHANTSEHIQKEVERAVSNGLTILPFRIENVLPQKALDYFIGSVHWLDAMTPPMERHLAQLADTVALLLDRAGRGGRTPSGIFERTDPPPAPPPARPPAANRAVLIGAGFLVAIPIGCFLLRPKSAGSDPAVGEWSWPGGAPVVVRPNGTFGAGPLEGTWQAVAGKARSYQLTWPPPTDQIALAPDGRSLSGINQYGIRLTGTRAGGGTSLPGEWRWSTGVPVSIRSDGTIQAGTFVGRWEPVDPQARTYRLIWPPILDAVTLTPDGQRLQGGNQYGIVIDAARK